MGLHIESRDSKLAGYFPDEVLRADRIKPIISCIIIISALMLVVFAKMEVRRLGYAVFKLTQTERDMRDEYRKKQITLAQLNRPERIEQIAQRRLYLKKAKKGQVIELIAGQVAFKH